MIEAAEFGVHPSVSIVSVQFEIIVATKSLQHLGIRDQKWVYAQLTQQGKSEERRITAYSNQ